MSNGPAKIASWHLPLAERHFGVVHRSGIKHQPANALSRLETGGEYHRPLDNDLPFGFVSWAIGDDSENEKHYMHD